MTLRNFLFIFIVLLLFIIVFFQIPKKVEINLLKIGNYTLEKNEFEKILKNNPLVPPELILDNYISVGILINNFTDSSYFNQKKFHNEISFIKKKEFLNYWKVNTIAQTKIRDFEIERSYNRFKNRKLKIDYIWIPIKEELVKNQIKKYIDAGETIEKLSNYKERIKWKKSGVKFFIHKDVDPGFFINKIEKIISHLNLDELAFIKTKSGYHFVKLVSENKTSNNLNSNDIKEQIKRNLAIAKQFEAHNIYINRSYLECDIELNREILSNINLQITPINYKNVNSDILAIYKDKEIRYNELEKQIIKLPYKVQSLFYNQSTRLYALTSLILLENNNHRITLTYQYKNKLLNEYIITNKIKNLALPELSDLDEILFLWFNQILKNSKNNDIETEIQNEFNISDIYDTNSIFQDLFNRHKMVLDKIATIEKEESFYNQWLYPENISNINELKINFELIENLPKKNILSNYNNCIIAFQNTWELTVDHLINIIESLTSSSRAELLKKNKMIQLIEYLAKNEGGILNTKNININDKILDEIINIIRVSFSEIRQVINENQIIGSLYDTKITVRELREVISVLPYEEKEKFYNISKREDALKKLLIQKFILKHFYNSEIKNDKLYKDRCNKAIYKFLIQDFYENEIMIQPILTNEENLNCQIRYAIDKLNQYRLEDYLFSKAKNTKIELNYEMIKKMNIDIKKSKYTVFLSN